VRSEILERHRETKIAVYAIWFRNLPADFRFFWPSSVLDDPRVVNLWDSQRAAGNWYAANLTHRKRGPEWDSWILYPPGKSFGDTSLAWGHTIVSSREELQSELEKVLESGERARTGKQLREPCSSNLKERCSLTTAPIKDLRRSRPVKVAAAGLMRTRHGNTTL
jgi:hypothetical protein